MPSRATGGRLDELTDDLHRLCPGRVSTSAPDREAYGRDLWPRLTIAVASGQSVSYPPDVIVWPTTTAEVSEIVRACKRRGVPLVPFGAGSGVAGGAIALTGGVLIDLKRMNRMTSCEPALGTATFEAGILGDHLEHELSRHGLTLGHFPSSIMCSTLGGWIAARSGGQLSTRYGKIEEMLRRCTFVDGEGRVHELVAGESPDLLQVLVGSEGTLGIITEATLIVRPAPETIALSGWQFERVPAGLEAIRRVLQRGLRPSVVRLYNELDSFLHKSEKDQTVEPEHHGHAATAGRVAAAPSLAERLKKQAIALGLRQANRLNEISEQVLSRVGRGCLLIIGFEGPAALVEAEAAVAGAELERAGGRDLGAGPGERWLSHRYDVSFRMSKVFDAGGWVDTMEVATSWSNLLNLYDGVRAAVAPHAFIMAHFSHAYAEGCSIYFTFAAKAGRRIDAERRYDTVWRAALDAVVAAGGTISHHHGIGLLKAFAMAAEHGPAMELFRGCKDVLDPSHILNPGKLGL